MSAFRIGPAAAAAVICFTFGAVFAHAASTLRMSERSDGALEMDGRELRCGSARSSLDPDLPNLGMSMPDAGLLVFNPALLRHESRTVRIFVFHHECGHQYVGGSEIDADCWAVRRGVKEGWLDRNGLKQVCRSFGGDPASPTHPSGARRCGSLNRCFIASTKELHRKAVAKAKPPVAPPSVAPRLVSGPRLIRSGAVR